MRAWQRLDSRVRDAHSVRDRSEKDKLLRSIERAGIKTLEGSLKKSKCFADFPSPQSQPGREDNREFSLTIKTPCM